MPLPALLSRRKLNVHKNTFGHILILAGSRNMLGAAALAGLSAMRAGAGLVTLGIPQGLNATVQKKISSVIMTRPLKETSQQTISLGAYTQLKKSLKSYQALAIGPGLSQNANTRKFILKIIGSAAQPIVIDADALNALAGNLKVLTKTAAPKILTPHPGEMARLTGWKKNDIEKNRKEVAMSFAKKHNCVLLLKGHRTIVAAPDGKTYLNKSGNPGMATAGSGDMLTGMLAAFLGQGLPVFDAAKWGAYLHGKAGDLAAKQQTRTAMITTDIIENIPNAFKTIR